MKFQYKTMVQTLVFVEHDAAGEWTHVGIDPKPPDDSGEWRIVHTMTRHMDAIGPQGVFVWEREVHDEDERESPLVGAMKALEATLDGVSEHLDGMAEDVKHGAEALSGIYRDMPTANLLGRR